MKKVYSTWKLLVSTFLMTLEEIQKIYSDECILFKKKIAETKNVTYKYWKHTLLFTLSYVFLHRIYTYIPFFQKKKGKKDEILYLMKEKYIKNKSIWSWCIFFTGDELSPWNPNFHVLYKDGTHLKGILFFDKKLGWQINTNVFIPNDILGYCEDIELLYHIDIVEEETNIKEYVWINNCNYSIEPYTLGELFFINKEMENNLIRHFIFSYVND